MRFIRTGAALTLLAMLVFVTLQVGPARAYQRLRDLDWLRSAAPSEQRATAHQALAFLLGDPHDAFAVLEQYEDRSSIPVLKTALARQPKDQDLGIECTWLHGRHALDRASKLPAFPSEVTASQTPQ